MFLGYSFGYYFADVDSFVEGYENGYKSGVKKTMEIYNLEGLSGLKKLEKLIN